MSHDDPFNFKTDGLRTRLREKLMWSVKTGMERLKYHNANHSHHLLYSTITTADADPGEIDEDFATIAQAMVDHVVKEIYEAHGRPSDATPEMSQLTAMALFAAGWSCGRAMEEIQIVEARRLDLIEEIDQVSIPGESDDN